MFDEPALVVAFTADALPGRFVEISIEPRQNDRTLR